ncbi:3-isopropylmalate dehydratase small subunit [Alloalcanivorax gelatiniphagus]|uniref:3-isopropylmalate dehydratase small subunit n=1 Tax=Alloalcanivorax gelatiniphagus TaxID=1194167 RepID=A0ABY2XHU7_9GAMM|nr:3-isopropylmalate dehydratase small subunit [Alloalcanivorax gelatiniphagus]TMW10613.1 3-isopropylmalate dehydratase small subunit [Alloalcanivorax gelatiniphagus]|tara:strand:+ start:2339 stop:2986 length:648 start_codon:yes stop_codon:yes gene_type:complete
MQAFTQHAGVVIPLPRRNVDTDAILPKQYLKKIDKEGFGAHLFDDERYLDPGDVDTPLDQRRPNPDFILNQEPYRRGSVLLAQANFGCGSSREHAVWALQDFGIRVVIAPSFGEIFHNNCFNNGVLPIVLPESEIEQLFELCGRQPEQQISVDLQENQVSWGDESWSFQVDPARREALLAGLDDIGITLERAEKIQQYEARRRREEPWLFHMAGR